jgi:hypothetical protein
MKAQFRPKRWTVVAACTSAILALIMSSSVLPAGDSGILARWCGRWCQNGPCSHPEVEVPSDDIGGTWYWLRSPDEEKRVVMGIFNRYCIRCHGVDGRGVWDIPGIPNFTNTVWQSSRSDGQIARIILEGRGAVMPPFRGALNLEEAWALARYLRTFVPGSEAPRPPTDEPAKTPSPGTPGKAPGQAGTFSGPNTTNPFGVPFLQSEGPILPR